MKTNKMISASSIGKTVYCPHAHYLSTKHKVGVHTQSRLNYGDNKHLHVGKIAEKQDKRCFVASYAIGENHQVTQELRDYRDAKLLTNNIGKFLVFLYYKLSPVLIRMLGNSTRVKAFAGTLVRLFHSLFVAKRNI